MTAPRASAHSRSSSPRRPWAAACALGSAVALVALAGTAGTASAAATPVLLGTAADYAVLAATTVTNTGSSVLTGNLGLSPGTSITGFPPGLVSGETHAGDTVASTAQDDLRTAYDAAAAQAPDTSITADLGGQTFLAGVHRAASSAGLTGAVTLDAQGTADAVFVFQIGSTLTTAAGSSVRLINGASACNVFWQVGSSATLGAGNAFAGTVLALESATLGNSTTVDGRVLARTGAVTLDADVVTRPACTAASTPGTTAPTPTASPGTEPSPAPTTAPTTTPTTPAPTASPTPSPVTPTGGGTPTTGGTPGTTTSGGGTTTGQRLTGGPAVTGGRPVVPVGAPETGGGGTAPSSASPLLTAGLLGLLAAAGTAGWGSRRTAPARHRSA